MIIRSLLANGQPKHVAVSRSSGAITYQELAGQVDDLASQLTNIGLRKGDRIAIALPNGLEVIASFLAASTVGTAAPLNPAYTRDEFKFYLEDTGARALIVPPKDSEEARAAAADQVLIIETELDADGRVQFSSAGTADAPRAFEDSKNDDIALILHTSGTTSRPKRVPLSHANLMTSARNVSETYQLTSEDVSLCVMPLFHVHGLVASTLGALFTGGTVVVSPRFNPLSFWSMVRDHRVSWYSAVPTIHQVLLARTRAGRPSGAEHLRFIRSCSAALPPQMMADVEERFGAPMVE